MPTMLCKTTENLYRRVINLPRECRQNQCFNNIYFDIKNCCFKALFSLSYVWHIYVIGLNTNFWSDKTLLLARNMVADPIDPTYWDWDGTFIRQCWLQELMAKTPHFFLLLKWFFCFNPLSWKHITYLIGGSNLASSKICPNMIQ